MDNRRKLALYSALAGSAAAATLLGLRYYRKATEREAAYLAEILDLHPGKEVVEVGAGKGQMTVRVSRLVQPTGRVLATEFEAKKLWRLHRSVEKSGAKNVSVVEGSPTGAELPLGSCDAIFMRGVYHHFTAPEEMNRSLFRALRPGGALVVIDFPPKLVLAPWTPKGIPANRGGHGIRQELLRRELAEAGFETVEQWDDWPFGMYCVVLRKPL